MRLAGGCLMDTYRPLPVVFVRGKGTRLMDASGREYLDFVSGIGVVNLGHCDPGVTAAVQEQVEKLVHVSNLYYNTPQVELARLLTQHSFADRVFFCNSGAEANEAAIKLVRKAARARGDSRRCEIITMEDSFHGRTLAALSATGQARIQAGFEPLVPGFKTVPYDDVAALEKAIDPRTAAVLVEPIQGEGGVRVPSKDYLKKLRAVCDAHGLFLILDEVQTGIGRTGRLFAYEHDGIEPDMVTVAKALGNGLPIGALLAREEVARAFEPGSHASTFGGNPVVCSAGRVVLQTLTGDSRMLETCRDTGSYLIQQLEQLAGRTPWAGPVRGRGLLVGMELAVDGQEIVRECLAEGVVINCTAGKVLRMIPPLIVTREEVDQLVAVLDRVFQRRISQGG